MKLLSVLLFFAPLFAGASPTSLTTRQSPQVQITGVTASGPGCLPGSFTGSITTPTLATFGFDAYQAAFGAGVPASDGESSCELVLSVQFPAGCTKASIEATYHGFALLSTGAIGIVGSNYAVSPGSVTGANPPSTLLTGPQWAAGDVFDKVDGTAVSVTVSSQQTVQFVVSSRLLATGTGSGQEGIVVADDVTVDFTGVSTC